MNGQSLIRRLLTKITIAPNGCWLWVGAGAVYGTIRVGGQWESAHRVSYALFVGPIPAGYVIDHEVCDTPRCINPVHLVAKTNVENVLRGSSPLAKNARKETCKYGHPFDQVRKSRSGRRVPSRVCGTCAQRQHVREGLTLLGAALKAGEAALVFDGVDLVVRWTDGYEARLRDWVIVAA